MPLSKSDHDLLVQMGKWHKSLIRLLAAQIDDDVLAYIAGLEYGISLDEHQRALQRIRAGESMPFEDPKTWIPREVLELFHWAEIDCEVGQKFPGSSTAFHCARAFCSAAWLEAYAVTGERDRMFGLNSHLVQLLYSLEEIAGEFEAAGPAFFAWLLTKLDVSDDERPFFIIALVYSLMRTRQIEQDAPWSVALVDWLFEEEALARESWGPGREPAPEEWLLGSTSYDLRHSKWADLAEAFVAHTDRVADASLAVKLHDIGVRLGG